jgi:hypothetical protein
MNDDMQVKYALARKLYLSLCEHKGFDAFEEPYIDPGTMRYAAIAVDMLGFDDQVLETIRERANA